MNIYATVEDYRAFTDDEQTPAKKIELYLRQQSAKLTAAANIKSELSEEAQSLACLLVCDAAAKALRPATFEDFGDTTGASNVSFSVNGFSKSVQLQNPSGSAYFDRSTLKAFIRMLGTSQKVGVLKC